MCHMTCRLRDDWLIVEALLLLLILVVNVYFLAWDDSLRQKEMANKARRVLAAVEGAYGVRSCTVIFAVIAAYMWYNLIKCFLTSGL